MHIYMQQVHIYILVIHTYPYKFIYKHNRGIVGSLFMCRVFRSLQRVLARGPRPLRNTGRCPQTSPWQLVLPSLTVVDLLKY